MLKPIVFRWKRQFALFAKEQLFFHGVLLFFVIDHRGFLLEDSVTMGTHVADTLKCATIQNLRRGKQYSR